MCKIRLRKRALAPLCALLAVGVLAGCANRDSITVGSIPDDYRTRHPIVITEKDEVLDLVVATSGYRMTPHQRAAIEGFIDGYRDTPGAVVTILVPAGSANASAALSASRDFMTLLRRSGVPEGHVQILSYQAGTGETAPVRLSYPVVRASAGTCGRWPEDMLQTSENRNWANFGCSYQNNLAAQVANPNDFLGPRKMTPIDAENRDVAIGDYKTRAISDTFIGRSEVDY